MRILYHLIYFIFIIHCSKGTIVRVKPLFHETSLIEDAIVSVVNEHFKDKILYISLSGLNRKTTLRQKDILDKTLSRIDNTLYLEDEGKLGLPHLRICNVFVTDSYTAFQLFVNQLKADIYDATGYFLIVLSAKNGNYYKHIEEILNDCWSNLIVNVVILVQSTINNVYVYTYFPFTEHHCRSVVPVIIAAFSDKSFTSTNFYPKKIGNLHKCPVTIATWEIHPFMYINKMRNGSVSVNGIEGNILTQLERYLNMTIKLLEPSIKGSPIGYIHENGSSTGIFEMLKRGGVDVSIGALRYSTMRARTLGITQPHYHSAMIIAVRPRLSYTSLETLLFPFDTLTWLGILFILIVSVLFITAIEVHAKGSTKAFFLGERNTTPIYNMWVALIGGPVNNCPKRNFARFALMLWLFMSAVLRGTYQGALYHFIRADTKKTSPNHIHALLKENYLLQVEPRLLDLISHNKDLQKNFEEKDGAYHDALMDVLTSKDKLGYLCPREFVTSFNNENYLKGQLHVVRERLTLLPVSILSRKFSYLIEPMNELLILFQSNGLIGQWSKDHNTQKSYADIYQTYPRKFSNRNFVGAYIIYVVLTGVSILVFLIEHVCGF